MTPLVFRRARMSHHCMLCALLALFKVSYGQYTDARKLEFPKGFDPFKTLGIPKKGQDGLDLPDKDVLKKAYKKGAIKWHPDRCKAEKEVCEKKMSEIALANEVLQDSRKLQQWDATRVDRLGGNKRKGPREGMGSFSGADFSSLMMMEVEVVVASTLAEVVAVSILETLAVCKVVVDLGKRSNVRSKRNHLHHRPLHLQSRVNKVGSR
eukprot:gnl/MRDRNA2_/MRDRNA2_30908_c0_seq1.p1 gnl/MRDRNA2_/MRDRNA2_30908_c0~~gnl/MRDRNA2_/MRDRNA2_30908_c0_seq1.p1  ORF type:complete len:209 (+),score=37.45 gnl/MRDRNA2_/MRDRNA2_30908_c0_seq1:100-726(+)